MTDRNGALIASVARMYYLDGMAQREIANVFGMSRSTVSRLLTTARDNGIVHISVRESDPFDHDLERALVEGFEIDEALVVRGVEGQPENIRRATAYFAAPVVGRWIRSVGQLGISGGRTIAQLISFMAQETHDGRLDIVPLMGIIGSTPLGTEASEMTRSLATRVQGAFYTINAPLFMDGPASRDVVASHHHIRSVLDVLPKLDLALVGIGTLDDSVLADRKALQPDALEALIKQGAVGEICGRFFDDDGEECDSELRDQVISIDFDTLRSINRVAAITSGSSRAKAIRAAMRGDLINVLVTDEQTARAVLNESL